MKGPVSGDRFPIPPTLDGFRALYARTPPVLRGIAFMLAATLFFASMQASIRGLSEDVHPFVMVFFRNIFGLLVFVPFFARQGLALFRTRRIGLLAFRSVLSVGAMLLFFSGLALTPLAKVVAIDFTGPLFGTLLAFLILGERIRMRRITALVVGFTGTMVIVRPGVVALDVGALLVLASTVFWGLAIIVIKVLSRTDSSATITLYMALIAIPITFVVALFVWQTPTWPQLGWLVAIGVLGNLGHLAVNQAFRETDVTAVLPFDFTRLLWATLLGYAFFGEVPHLTTWIGAVMIFSAVVYITYRESRLRAAEAEREAPAS